MEHMDKKQQRRELKRKTSSNVISFRISDKERRALEKMTRASSRTISELMREAIELWSASKRNVRC